MNELVHVPETPLLMPSDFKAYGKVTIQNSNYNKYLFAHADETWSWLSFYIHLCLSWETPSWPPSHALPSKYKVKEYCPLVFRDLRDRFGEDPDDYVVCVCVCLCVVCLCVCRFFNGLMFVCGCVGVWVCGCACMPPAASIAYHFNGRSSCRTTPAIICLLLFINTFLCVWCCCFFYSDRKYVVSFVHFHVCLSVFQKYFLRPKIGLPLALVKLHCNASRRLQWWTDQWPRKLLQAGAARNFITHTTIESVFLSVICLKSKSLVVC